jgi:hypothetical protein
VTRSALAAAAVLLALGATPLAWAGDGALYAGPEQDPVFGDIAPELATALFPGQRLKLVPLADTEQALDHVAADPTSLAVADLASTLDYAARHGLPPERLEFGGELAHRCVLAFALRGGWLHGFADLTAAPDASHPDASHPGTPRPSIGVAGPDGTLAILQRLDPGLAGLDAQPGTASQLAARVARGTLDAMLLVAYPEFDQDAIERLSDNDKLVRVPVVTRLLSRAAAGPESGFTLSTAASGPALLPWTPQPDPTLCSPVGIVSRDDAPAALRQALPAAERAVAAALHKPSLTEHAMTTARGAVRDAIATARGWLHLP